jgi:glycosyltransferase involved in cell wall biosynthesis
MMAVQSTSVPRVSVIMTVKDGMPFVREAIDGILGQTFTDFEFIIINDGSVDGTPQLLEMVQDVRARIVHQDNWGIRASLNTAVRMSRGEYLARMDADDVSEPERLERQVEYLDADPCCVAVGTDAWLIDTDGTPIVATRRPQDHESIVLGLKAGSSSLIHGSVMMRRAAVVSVGMYPDLPMEDWGLWVLLSACGRLSCLSETLYRYRIRPQALTSVTREAERCRQAVIRDVLTNGFEATKRQRQLIRQVERALLRGKVGEDRYLVHISQLWLLAGDRHRARHGLVLAIAGNPTNPRAWLYLAFSLLPLSVARRWLFWRNPSSTGLTRDV